MCSGKRAEKHDELPSRSSVSAQPRHTSHYGFKSGLRLQTAGGDSFLIKIIYVCMNALLKACHKHVYQRSHQIRFKIKAPFPLMSARNANAFVWDRDVIVLRRALWWVSISGF